MASCALFGSRYGGLILVAVTCLTDVQASDTDVNEDPDMAFLEYLGMWDESDDEWQLLDDDELTENEELTEDKELTENDKSTENDDEI